VHRASALETWAALTQVDQTEPGLFERSVGAFDLFILDDAKGDVDDVSVRHSGYDPRAEQSMADI
jgi:hypothetical protein